MMIDLRYVLMDVCQCRRCDEALLEALERQTTGGLDKHTILYMKGKSLMLRGHDEMERAFYASCR
jgi:hypothetical protein